MIAKHPGECKPHKYQDERYGQGFRVMNPAKKGKELLGYRCTVCCPDKVATQKRGGIFPVEQLVRR